MGIPPVQCTVELTYIPCISYSSFSLSLLSFLLVYLSRLMDQCSSSAQQKWYVNLYILCQVHGYRKTEKKKCHLRSCCWMKQYINPPRFNLKANKSLWRDAGLPWHYHNITRKNNEYHRSEWDWPEFLLEWQDCVKWMGFFNLCPELVKF